MKRQAGVLIVVALALVALGQLAGRDGVWAAPGQSPERQSYPSMTPSRRPGEPTHTRTPGPTEPPGPPPETPGPTSPASPTDTPVAHTFTPTPAAPTGTLAAGTLSPTAIGGDTAEPAPTLAPTASAKARPLDTQTTTAVPVEATETMVPTASQTVPSATEIPAGTTATPRPVLVSATLPAESGTPLDEGLLAALGRDWMLICGLGLLILALLVFILGYILGRRRGER